jgi:hypothetical protein
MCLLRTRDPRAWGVRMVATERAEPGDIPILSLGSDSRKPIQCLGLTSLAALTARRRPNRASRPYMLIPNLALVSGRAIRFWQSSRLYPSAGLCADKGSGP